jgi:hypothetical protein
VVFGAIFWKMSGSMSGKNNDQMSEMENFANDSEEIMFAEDVADMEYQYGADLMDVTGGKATGKAMSKI